MTEAESIVRYWHAVELLQPQSAPKRKQRNGPYDALVDDTPIRRPILPWTPVSKVAREVLPKNRVWSHTLFAHVYDSSMVAGKLKQLYGADQGYREPQARESALFAAKFTADGRAIAESVTLSSEAWFLGRVLTNQDWSRGFEADQESIRLKALSLLSEPVTSDALRTLTRWILDFIGVADFFGDMDTHAFRFRSQPIKEKKPEPEDDPLNSFLLGDLADVADRVAVGDISVPLAQFLQRHDPQRRVNIDEDRASLKLIDRLMPDAYADSCWPTQGHQGLVHSQQLAVNSILSTLADGDGLMGVNGPPGTGKTTLLRDLIATVITRRADVLAGLRRASDAFAKDGPELGSHANKPQSGHKLDPKLYGFEIAVASSNNGAVENITLELPQRDKIDADWLPDAEHFAELGALLSGKPAWGLISGALGSKARRKQFVKRYFEGEAPAVREKKDSAQNDETVADDDDIDADSAQYDLLFATRAEIDTEDEDEPADANQSPLGFSGWLNERATERTAAERLAIWQTAVSEYKAAKAEERAACEDARNIREQIDTISRITRDIADQREAVRATALRLADAECDVACFNGEDQRVALAKLDARLAEHRSSKPGWWARLRSLGQVQRDWKAQWTLLNEQRNVAGAESDRIARLARDAHSRLVSLTAELSKARGTLQQSEFQRENLKTETIAKAEKHRAAFLLAWLRDGAIGRGDEIELAEPWQIDGWRKARARVFLQALKLHRTFFELEAKRMWSNLSLINGLLNGARYQGFSHDVIRSAWASLFMVVPVLSSTFASFARTFGSLRAGEIGWLLVDEAGQATPQAAVGALWRSRRALLVGDPLQLRPIITVSDAALEHMRTRYRVDAHWLPNRQSAQTLADEATDWGRMAGPSNAKQWVGLPLVVHRCCDRPMYELANRIAYDGAMVYGTSIPKPAQKTPARLETGWIHVTGTSTGNWVRHEGHALKALLESLEDDGVEADDISVITPFRDVQRNLKTSLRRKLVTGTIHTMQGKEAPIVILMLGGSTTISGARDWVVSEPNLLNVAATRAKQRLYVIGDREDWKQRALFCQVMDCLPLQPLRVPESPVMLGTGALS